MKQNSIFITWNNYNSRSKSIADAIGAKSYFIGKSRRSGNPIINVLDYPYKIFKNISIVLKDDPDIIVVSNTQLIITLVNYILSLIKGFRIVLDSHSSAFDHPFYKYPKSLSFFLARKANVSLVTNEKHKNVLNMNGAKAFVLTDIPSDELGKVRGCYNVSNKFNICFVCTFSDDEPIEEAFKAAENLENVEFYVTGNSSRLDSNINIPKNVNITGFLEREEYDSLLNSVDAIMCLTTRHDTMQRGGSEAISVRKPLITSDTKLLNEYFSKGTSFVKPDSESIKNGIEFIINNKESLKIEMDELNKERQINFESVLDSLMTEIKLNS